MPIRILVICMGNSCRSQMAEGILKSIDPSLEIYSAGIYPTRAVSSKAIKVMKEIGIDLSNAYPKHVDQFLNEPFDYVVTVCDLASEMCPAFNGEVKHRLHIGFRDPSFVVGTEDEVMEAHREVRDEMIEKFREFYINNIKGSSE